MARPQRIEKLVKKILMRLPSQVFQQAINLGLVTSFTEVGQRFGEVILIECNADENKMEEILEKPRDEIMRWGFDRLIPQLNPKSQIKRKTMPDIKTLAIKIGKEMKLKANRGRITQVELCKQKLSEYVVIGKPDLTPGHLSDNVSQYRKQGYF